MGIIADAEADQRPTGPLCKLKQYLDEIDPVDADEFRQLLWSPSQKHIRHTTIARLLTGHGFVTSADNIGRHRHVECVRCRPDSIPYRDGS
jgi:hypothetical protein